MQDWKESVFSDGTENFVSNPEPSIGEEIAISVQLLADAPVRAVFLRFLRNGTQVLVEAVRECEDTTESRNGNRKEEDERHCTESVRSGNSTSERAHLPKPLARYTAKMTITQPVTKYRFLFAAEDGVYSYNQQGIVRYFLEASRDFTLLTDYRRPHLPKGTVYYQIFPERFSTGDIAREDDPANGLFLGEYPFYRFYGGTLDGVRRRIPYLRELGVTAIYLNPIFLAPSTHKYDCADYLQVDRDFGGDEVLAALSKELHENGMQLMLDISINHTGRQHLWFRDRETRERFYLRDEKTGEYLGWAGAPGLPVLDYRNEEVRRKVYRDADSVLRKWLRPPYDIDGWRFDVADVFGRHDEVQLADELWREVRAAIREEKPGAYIVAEEWGDCCAYEQGDSWDTSMNYYGCARPLREFYGVPDLFNERDEILKALAKPLPAEVFAEQVMAHLSHIPGAFWENQFNLFDSHDIPRLHNMPGMDAELYRGAVLLLFLFPGVPSIYYGDEVGIGGGSEGDAAARWPMPWREIRGLWGEREAVASADETSKCGEVFFDVANKEEKTNSCEHIYTLYKKLISLRKTCPALHSGSFTFLYARGRVLSIARFTKDETLVGIVSASQEPERVFLPLWRLGATKPEDGSDLLGRTFAWKMGEKGELIMELSPKAALLFRCQ